MAEDVAQKLLRIGLSSHAFQDAHLALTSAVLLKDGDVAIGISTSGETPDVIEPLRRAGRPARPRSPSPTTPARPSRSWPSTC
ncbi:SIS domain-containing protein [Nonomuraea ferruginea]